VPDGICRIPGRRSRRPYRPGLLSRPLAVANQNVNLPINGEIDVFNRRGVRETPIVPSSEANAPPAPRGIIVTHNHLFVASLSGLNTLSNGMPSNGELQEFVASGPNAGRLVAEFAPQSPLGATTATFHPRGVVLGPDGSLYVSNDPALGGEGGQVLRFDPHRLAAGPHVVVDDAKTCSPAATCDFNRPEGLVFAPDGGLYVTSFENPTNPASSDKIMVFGLKKHRWVLSSEIPLDQPGGARQYAEALLFGPRRLLYLPISNPSGTGGEVLSYDVHTKVFTTVVAAGTTGAPEVPWYLTFGRTNPATLAYRARS
jgi:hypothetical protein